MKQWGKFEFDDRLLKMVNEPDEEKWNLEKTKLFTEDIPNKNKTEKASTPSTKDATPELARENFQQFQIAPSQTRSSIFAI